MSNIFEYQNPPEADHLWCESFYFPIVVPEENLYATVYINIRPGLGVMWNTVMVFDTLTDSRADLLHYNENHYLPAPKRLAEIVSPIGLKIRGVNLPRDFVIDYEHEDGTAFHVTWSGMMDPFDIHDPSHSPQAGRAKDVHAHAEIPVYNKAGHIDMTGRIQGTLTVRGQTYQVDSIERMDHSWGPRNPMKMADQFIVSATFGPDLAFHMICPWYPDKTGPEAFELSHGYVMEDGEVYGLTNDAVITAQHHGMLITNMNMSVKDVRGKKYQLRATSNIGAPWINGPNIVAHNALMNWFHEGKEGYGVVMKAFSLRGLIEKRGRFGNEQTAVLNV